jgi:hypothetical protein
MECPHMSTSKIGAIRLLISDYPGTQAMKRIQKLHPDILELVSPGCSYHISQDSESSLIHRGGC